MIRPRAVIALSATLLAAAVGAAAQVPRREPPPMALESLTGRDSFDRYCASCHGVSGTGNGQLASSLKTRPADLTQLAQKNGGEFPRRQVTEYVEGTGRRLPAHGATEMPLWGGIFRWLDTAPRARVRIGNLVAYVESLQAAGPQARQASVKPVSGADLFRAFCASCHGANASGDGPMADQLTRRPPDLTKLQIANRGSFPATELRRIIDGRAVAAHGDRTMPVWGDVFLREAEGGKRGAEARIEALVEYLRSIQERRAE